MTTNRDQDLRTALDELSKRATQGPWAAESEKSEGSYGSGEDTHEGYDTATIVTETEIRHGAPGVLFESHNSTVGSIREEHDDEWFRAWDEVSEANAKFIVALVNAYRAGDLTAPPRPDHAGGVETEALREAESICRALYRKHYREDAPNWQPLTGDLVGLLSQIDNMTAGLTRAASPAQAPDKAAELEGLIDRLDRLAKDGWSGSVEKWCEQAIFAMSAASLYLAALAPKPTGTEKVGRPIEEAPRDGTPIIAWGAPSLSDPDDFEWRQTRWTLYGEGSIAHARFKAGQGPEGYWSWSEPMHNWGSSWEPTRFIDLPATPMPPLSPDSTAQGDGTSQEGGR